MEEVLSSNLRGCTKFIVMKLLIGVMVLVILAFIAGMLGEKDR